MKTFRDQVNRDKIIQALKKQKIPSYDIRWERIYTFCERKYLRKYCYEAGIAHLTVNRICREETVSLGSLNKLIKFFNKPRLRWVAFKYEKSWEQLKLSDVAIPLNLRAKKQILGIERITIDEI